MKKKRNKYIYLKKYTLRRRNVQNVDDFRNDILTHLGDEIFEYETLDELVFNCLKVIYPANISLKKTEQSLQKKSSIVVQHFFDKTFESRLYKIGDKGEHIVQKSKKGKSSKEKFLYDIIRFKEVPKKHWEYLNKNSEYHLISITRLVNKYLNTSFISKVHWKEEKSPSNQEERMLLDYYKRCLSEQQVILTYRYGDKMRDRAIAKATKMPFNFPNSFLRIFDFPYYSSKIYSEGHFDHELIEKVYHRLADTTIYEEDETFRELYFKNKRLFYSKLFKEYTANQYFNDIKYYSQILPLSEIRKNILSELEFLFHKKKWVSFYGMALSQVEGLFLEMTNIGLTIFDWTVRRDKKYY